MGHLGSFHIFLDDLIINLVQTLEHVSASLSFPCPGTLAHQLHFKPYGLGYQPWHSQLTLGLFIFSSFGSHPDPEKPSSIDLISEIKRDIF